jgi:branched-chain amino acid transport system substrate-binding protein
MMNTSSLNKRDGGEKSMETKQIVAVVLIVIIIAGVGVGLYLFMPAAPYGALVIGQLVAPGAPAGTPSDHIVKIGILDPMTEIQGDGAWKGAYLACDEINSAGGITVGGETYYLGIIAEDTFESETSLDLSKGTAAATKIITQDGAQFIIGGFRTESVLAYQEIIMDAKMLFFGTGASTDIFCSNVVNSTLGDRYQYFFRLMPTNSTSLARSLLTYILYLKSYLGAVYNKTISKVAIIRENLDWTVPMFMFLNSSAIGLPHYGLTIVKDAAYPITAEATDFATYWQQIDAAGAQITIPIISAQGGILMSTQYAQVQPKTFLAGIDVMSQLDSYWNETGGACQYEVELQSVLRTNLTSLTIPFWDAFLDHYDSSPLYTAVGSYDAIYVLAEGIERAQSFNSTLIVPHLEDIDVAHPFDVAGGSIAFTPSHDLFAGYIGDQIYSVTLLCQWQAGGYKHVVTTGGLLYPDSIVTANLTRPPWGIN